MHDLNCRHAVNVMYRLSGKTRQQQHFSFSQIGRGTEKPGTRFLPTFDLADIHVGHNHTIAGLDNVLPHAGKERDLCARIEGGFNQRVRKGTETTNNQSVCQVTEDLVRERLFGEVDALTSALAPSVDISLAENLHIVASIIQRISDCFNLGFRIGMKYCRVG